MNLITLHDVSVAEIETMIDTSIQIKQNPLQYGDALNNKALYMLFEKTSTRTALGFGLGFQELGGRYFIQRWQDSNFTVGDVTDEIRYVATNVDIILARLKHKQTITAMGQASPVPVINGCCDTYHPTQALADCMTIKELFGTYQKTVVYVGIWNNVFHSLALSLPRLGGKLIGVCPIINDATISVQEAETLVKNTENLEVYSGADASPKLLKDLTKNADIVYTDTWVDMEFFNNPDYQKTKEERTSLMKPFALTSELLGDSQAIVLHDMPMHPGYEIERDVIERHISTILQQGENRRPHSQRHLFTRTGITLIIATTEYTNRTKADSHGFIRENLRHPCHPCAIPFSCISCVSLFHKNMTIRPIIDADAAAIDHIIRDLGYFAHLNDEPAEESTARIQRHIALCLADDSHSLFVAEETNRIILGYTAVHWLPYLLLKAPEGYVSELFVANAARGKGVGSALLQHVKDAAISRGCSRLALINRRIRESYQREFYKKHGWIEQAEDARFVLNL